MKLKQKSIIVFIFIIFNCWQQCFGLYHNYTKHYTVTVGMSITLNYPGIWRAKSFGANLGGAGAECLSVRSGYIGQNGWCEISAVNKTSNVPYVTVSYHYVDAKGLITDIFNYINNITIVELESVNIPSTLTLNTGKSYTFSPILTPSNATTIYKWYSSDESIVKVKDGVITAIKEGSAIITCMTHNGKTAECKVTIKPLLVEKLTMQPTDLKIACGQRYQLNAIISPENASIKKLKWESSNQDVAIVTSEGLVVALSPGWSVITANTTDGSDVSANCILEVEPIKVESVSLSQATIRGYVGSSVQLTASILPETATTKSVKWASNAPATVSVDENGLVKLLKEGVAVVTATTTDGSNLSASCEIQVDPVLAESISLDRHALILEKGDAATLKASIEPTGASHTIMWSSSNTSTVTVDEFGTVTAIDYGSATIKVTTADGTNLSDSCIVKVSGTSNLNNVENTSIQVYAKEGKICISNLDEGEKVKIYNSLGQIIYNGTSQNIEVREKGLYIVVAAGFSIKVSL